MRNFRLNFANIFAKMNVGKKFENDAKFWKKATFFRENAKCKFCFFCEIFAFFAEHIEAKFRKKISFIRVTDLREFSYFSRANEIQKYAKMFTKIFLLRNYRKPIFSFLLPVPSKRVRGFFPFCSQSHQNEWEDGDFRHVADFFSKKEKYLFV